MTSTLVLLLRYVGGGCEREARDHPGSFADFGVYWFNVNRVDFLFCESHKERKRKGINGLIPGEEGTPI